MTQPSKFAALLGVIALSSFLFTNSPADDNAAGRQDVNAGYFLLHKLFDDESKLNILMALKHSPHDIQDFANQISQTAKTDLSVLDKIRKSDASVNWDQNPLPKFEQDVRKSIADEKQHQLLFGTKNDDFVRAVLISQAEAANYAANLAKVMSQRTKDRDMQRDFTRMSDHWHALYDKDFQLLKNY
jgi:hypothetical protein